MNPSLENPFRNPAQRAKKRLFRAEPDEDIIKIKSEKAKNKIEKLKVKYGPHELLLSHVQFLKQLEKLIPKKVLEEKKLTAREILIDGITKIDNKGNILNLDINYLELKTLPKLPATLQQLACSNNRLGNLPKLPSTLQTLICQNNQLSSLPKLPAVLQELVFGDNQLSSLPELPPTLNNLDCSGNQLSSLPELPAALQTLYCEHNQLRSLPALPAALQKLECRSNQLSQEGTQRIKDHKNSAKFKF